MEISLHTPYSIYKVINFIFKMFMQFSLKDHKTSFLYGILGPGVTSLLDCFHVCVFRLCNTFVDLFYSSMNFNSFPPLNVCMFASMLLEFQFYFSNNSHLSRRHSDEVSCVNNFARNKSTL